MEEKAWQCTVCGYVHQGQEPPGTCPICGAGKEVFEPFQMKARSETKSAPVRWLCLNCNYLHSGASPPDTCPVCGVSSEGFAPDSSSDAKSPDTDKALKIIIAGAGIAGVSAAEAIREISASSDITLVSKENELPYYRLNLTRYLAGETEESALPIHDLNWYAQKRIRLNTGDQVTAIDVNSKQISFMSGGSKTFDKLILTTGSHAFFPPFPGADKKGIAGLRTLEDARLIQKNCRKGAKCIVIGGGILGLEVAAALAKQGAKTHLLEGHHWLLPRQLNHKAGILLASYAEDLGIKLLSQTRVREITGDKRVCGVKLENGETIPADWIVVTTGVRSNSSLARLAGLQVNRGTMVNNRLCTSHPDIFAAGDAAEYQGILYGTWNPAQYQGTIAGLNAAGGENQFAGIPRSNMLKVLGVDLFSIGRIQAEDASYTELEYEKDGQYARFLMHDNILTGSILLGFPELMNSIKKTVESREDLTGRLNRRPSAEGILDFLKSQAN